jgi:hypothetical protein
MASVRAAKSCKFRFSQHTSKSVSTNLRKHVSKHRTLETLNPSNLQKRAAVDGNEGLELRSLPSRHRCGEAPRRWDSQTAWRPTREVITHPTPKTLTMSSPDFDHKLNRQIERAIRNSIMTTSRHDRSLRPRQRYELVDAAVERKLESRGD